MLFANLTKQVPTRSRRQLYRKTTALLTAWGVFLFLPALAINAAERPAVTVWPEAPGAPASNTTAPIQPQPATAAQLTNGSPAEVQFTTWPDLYGAPSESRPADFSEVQLLSHQPAAQPSVGEGVPAGEEAQFGEAPPETRNLFLRRQAVLLQPGQFQLDVGVTYTLLEQDFPILSNTTPPQAVKARLRQRTIQTPLGVRYGWSRNVQLFAATSFGWMNSEIGVLGDHQSTDDGGMGDTTFGASMLLSERYQDSPDVIFTLRGTAPTSDAGPPLIAAPLESQLGTGMWGIGGDLLFIKTVDPLVVFWGGGVHYLFEREFAGITVQPGLRINYNLGVGFSVNERVTLSSALLGAYVTDYYLEGQRLEGSSQELIRMRFAMTIAQKRRIIEPFAEIGATDDAPATHLGIIFTY